MQQVVPIYENYGAYRPRTNARRIVTYLLTTVESNYLQGLGSIVLSSQTVLSRKKRRQKNWRLGRKISTSQTLGYYQGACNGKPAFIDLYIDKIFAEVPAWAKCFPVVAFFVISAVFFHELGHHIHHTRRPEFKEPEGVADEWSKKLSVRAIRKRYWYLRPFLPKIARTIAHMVRR